MIDCKVCFTSKGVCERDSMPRWYEEAFVKTQRSWLVDGTYRLYTAESAESIFNPAFGPWPIIRPQKALTSSLSNGPFSVRLFTSSLRLTLTCRSRKSENCENAMIH
jgi:hypothetical protein